VCMCAQAMYAGKVRVFASLRAVCHAWRVCPCVYVCLSGVCVCLLCRCIVCVVVFVCVCVCGCLCVCVHAFIVCVGACLRCVFAVYATKVWLCVCASVLSMPCVWVCLRCKQVTCGCVCASMPCVFVCIHVRCGLARPYLVCMRGICVCALCVMCVCALYVCILHVCLCVYMCVYM
jgi:hypothetical protein